MNETLRIAEQEGLAFNLRTDCGVLVAYVDDAAGLAAAEGSRAVKEAAGVDMQLLSKEQVLQQEPCLNSAVAAQLTGGVVYANDAFVSLLLSRCC